MTPLADMMAKAKARTDERRWNERVGELVSLIDELATERGSCALVEAVRQRGYNIEADCGALSRRGVKIN
ncbi:hypothetical protein EN866_19405 [Mesorhizobium sp. M2D.F.Ca.ET.223.01.1.1]|nr:hypothetical protein [Mesorhizobium sp. M2D.F.Ca.ET.223.01.1.1]TGR89627.1 hypothetical protein EN866_19405 [Mesorhizobium sp. M2D.F.Ca.ET.223.01.1.1]